MSIGSLFYRLAYRSGRPRWDSTEPRPELVELAQGRSPGRALDLGCGTGTDCIYLAGQVEVSARLGDRGDVGDVGVPAPGGNPVIAADVDHEIKLTPDAGLAQAGDVPRSEAGGGS